MRASQHRGNRIDLARRNMNDCVTNCRETRSQMNGVTLMNEV